MDIATPLSVLAERAMDDLMDSVASEGLSILYSLLEQEGFSKSEHLRDYKALAHVSGREIRFEIILDIEAVDMTAEVEQNMEQSREEVEQRVAKTYGISAAGPQKLEGMRDARRDARTPARDARTPARDARRTSRDRLIDHEVALHAPRSLDVTKQGKISISFTRTLREDDKGAVHFPRAKFGGIVEDFYDRLTALLRKEFGPRFGEVLARRFQ